MMETHELIALTPEERRRFSLWLEQLAEETVELSLQFKSPAYTAFMRVEADRLRMLAGVVSGNPK